MLVEGVTVPKTGQKTPSPRQDATEVLVEGVTVPKTGQKTPSPREDATEVLVEGVAVPKTGQKTLFATWGCHRDACRRGGPAR